MDNKIVLGVLVLLVVCGFALYSWNMSQNPAGKFTEVTTTLSVIPTSTCNSNSDCPAGSYCLEVSGVKSCTAAANMPPCVDQDSGNIFVPGSISGPYSVNGQYYTIMKADPAVSRNEQCIPGAMIPWAMSVETICQRIPEGFDVVEISTGSCPGNNCNAQNTACACTDSAQCGVARICSNSECILDPSYDSSSSISSSSSSSSSRIVTQPTVIQSSSMSSSSSSQSGLSSSSSSSRSSSSWSSSVVSRITSDTVCDQLCRAAYTPGGGCQRGSVCATGFKLDMCFSEAACCCAGIPRSTSTTTTLPTGCPGGGAMVLTDYFNFNEDTSSHGYNASGVVYPQPAYDCDGGYTLRIGSCASGSGVVSVNLNVTAGTPIVQLVFASPWQAGGVSAFTLDGTQFSRSCSPLSCGCSQNVSVPAGSTSDGVLRLTVSDITPGNCNSDWIIDGVWVYSCPVDLTSSSSSSTSSSSSSKISSSRATLPPSCVDSDGGLMYYTKGTVTAVNGSRVLSFTDRCLSVASLNEYYCSGVVPMASTYTCAGRFPACSDGRCAMCGDSDGGLALTVYGQTKGANIGFGTWINDSCKDSRTLYEGFCSGSYVNRTEVACPSFAPFCTNGQCVASCTDSDGGNVTYVKGSIVGVNAGFGTSAADSCASVGTLYEYYCDGTALKRYSFTCAGRIPACSDGRCVACADTDSGLNYVVQGTTKGGLGAFGNYVTDSCKDSKTLYEYYCGGGSYVNRTEVACPVATPNCLNGICKA